MDLLNYETNKKEFLEIIKNKSVRTVLQPILSLRSGNVEGYEALTRGPSGSFFENPENLFRISQTCNMVWELEYLCRAKALEKFGAQGVRGRLFLNVNPNVMHDSKFRKGFTKGYIEQFNINPERIVFEITEREAVRKVVDFHKEHREGFCKAGHSKEHVRVCKAYEYISRRRGHRDRI